VATCAHKATLVSRFSRERTDAAAGLAALRLSKDEGSALLDCIGESVGLLDGQAPRRAVVLITDGRVTSLSGSALESAVERLGRRLEQFGVEFHVLGQGRESWLEALARTGNGSWRAPWHGKGAVSGLARQLGPHYRVAFQADSPSPGRQPVQVRVSGTGLTAHASAGYRWSADAVPAASD
jgi:hypothetical protein